MLIHIDALDDERLDAYAKLTDVQLRNRLEPEKGIFIAESPKVIARALGAGMQPLSMLTSDTLISSVGETVSRIEGIASDAPVFVMPGDALEELAGFHLAHGALAAFRRPEPPSLDEVLADARRVAVLEDITNYTNVGAIFRSAAALGVDAVLVTPGCYDPLYRRAIRVSMGAVFKIPWTRIGDGDAPGRGDNGNVERKGGWSKTGIPLLHEAGFQVVSLALSDDAVPIDDARLCAEPRLAIVLGTEGEGLSPATMQASDHVARIPMHREVDSLNVAAASAVAFWQLCR